MLMFSPNLNRRKILMCARSTKPKEECYRTFIGTLFVCIRFILPSASHCPLVPFTVFVSMHNTFRLQNSTNSCAIEVFQCRGLLFLRLSINRHITRLETIIITKIKTKKKNARNLSGIERWANEQVGYCPKRTEENKSGTWSIIFIPQNEWLSWGIQFGNWHPMKTIYYKTCVLDRRMFGEWSEEDAEQQRQSE